MIDIPQIKEVFQRAKLRADQFLHRRNRKVPSPGEVVQVSQSAMRERTLRLEIDRKLEFGLCANPVTKLEIHFATTMCSRRADIGRTHGDVFIIAERVLQTARLHGGFACNDPSPGIRG